MHGEPLDWQELRPGHHRIGNAQGHMLMDEIAELREDVNKLRAEVKDVDKLRAEVARLNAELRPVQGTAILYRKCIFENVLRATGRYHDQQIVDERNHSAHGGDVVMDVKMTADAQLRDYDDVFRELYGIRQRALRDMEEYKDMTAILNIRADIYLDRTFPRHVERYIKRLVDDAVDRFQYDLSEWEREDDLRRGELATMVTEITRAYRQRRV